MLLYSQQIKQMVKYITLVLLSVLTFHACAVTKLEILNIQVGKFLGNKATIRIPIDKIDLFLSLEGIEYFEMNPSSSIN